MTRWEWAGIGIGAAAVLVLGVGALVIYQRGRVVGPLFWYELVVLARRGQQPRLRALLVGLLLVGLFVTYLYEFRGQELVALTGGAQLDQSARFAGAFLNAFLIAQLLAVILITPAMVGGAITEEKEHGTLDFLRTSLLTNREIVLGKFAARLAFVGGVLLAGVPVLALTSLFGGVDLWVLLAGYTITVMSALSLGAFSLYVGVVRDTLREVLVRVYTVTLWVTVFGSCCACIPGVAAVSPPSALGWMLISEKAIPTEPAFWLNVGLFTLIHTLVAVWFTALAVLHIRSAPVRAPATDRKRIPPHPLPVIPEFGDDPVPAASDADGDPLARNRARRMIAVPSIGNTAPLLWKERYFASRLAWAEHESVFAACLSMIVFMLGMVLFFSAIKEVNSGRWIGGAVNPVARLTLTGIVMLTGLLMGVRAASSVARERQQRTLDGLLSLPVDRSDLLWAKWIAPLRWANWALWVTASVGVGSLLVGGIHPIGFGIATIQGVGWMAFANTLGLWLSVGCRTVTRATVYFIAWGLVLWIGPLLLMPLAMAAFGETGRAVTSLSLPFGLWQSLFGWQEFAEEFSGRDAETWRMTRNVAALAGAGYAVAAWVLWKSAVKQFEREGKEG